MTTAQAEEEIIEMEEAVEARKRDLRDTELKKAGDREMALMDITERPDQIVLYRTDTGEPTPFPDFMKAVQLRKLGPDGKRVFTATKSRAPTFTRGSFLCFFHPEAPEAADVKALGITAKCRSAHLGSEWAREQHASTRHRKEWASYQAMLERREREADRQERRDQTAAMLALAKSK